MDVRILPLAITMMAGPQILFALLLITSSKPVKFSLAYIAAVGIAATLGVSVMTFIVSSLGALNPSPTSNSQIGEFVEIGLVILLIIMSIKTYINRKNIQQPKWMSTIESITSKKSFMTGLLLILLMPSDLIVMLTVGTHLFTENLPIIAAAPFLALTLLVAALPLIAYLIFRKRAEFFMPKARDWVANHGALVNIAIYLFFIILIIS